jgi:hypothetical protein
VYTLLGSFVPCSTHALSAPVPCADIEGQDKDNMRISSVITAVKQRAVSRIQILADSQNLM